VKSSKFGNGKRYLNKSKSDAYFPGPGHHSPDYKILFKKPPLAGFGTETRKIKEVEYLKSNPGPGKYTLPNIIGNDGPSKSISPTKRFNNDLNNF